MIVLDTNVVSELMKPSPSPLVLNWLRAQKQEDLSITAITLAEIWYGLGRLPDGKRRGDLHRRFEILVNQGFQGHLLAFEAGAALIYGKLCNARLGQGLHVDAFDMLIAAIAQVNNCAVATRNMDDFQGCSLDLVNPFAA